MEERLWPRTPFAVSPQHPCILGRHPRRFSFTHIENEFVVTSKQPTLCSNERSRRLRHGKVCFRCQRVALEKSNWIPLPEYGAGGISWERSCVIFSFGVLLAKLWTGKLQNHNDENCNFGKLCVDIKTNLDPALGDETWALLNYVKDFAGLGICSMRSISPHGSSSEKRKSTDLLGNQTRVRNQQWL